MPVLKAYPLQGERAGGQVFGWGWTGRAWVQAGWSERGWRGREAFPLPGCEESTLQWLGELGGRRAALSAFI